MSELEQEEQGHEVVGGDTEHLLDARARVQRDVVLPDHVHVDDGRDLLDERAVELLGLTQAPLRLLPADRGAERARRHSEGVDLGAGPLALVRAIVEPDGAPPLLPGEDRHVEERHDALSGELFPRGRREVGDVHGPRLAPAESGAPFAL